MTGPQLRNETKPIRLLSRDKRAERRLGEMMAEQKETIGLAKPPTEKDEMGRFTVGVSDTPTAGAHSAQGIVVMRVDPVMEEV
jgi:hypothetical protein